MVMPSPVVTHPCPLASPLCESGLRSKPGEATVSSDRAESGMSTLAAALRRASSAHGEHEKRTGEADPKWPDWYAAYMVAEQAGDELQT